ncbi:hypothetical protein HMN09_01158900 [Mycena chlorophos]|uniref:Uncharacterized protein n=1 Tax=Mycena chlorophos TaxID=658473 RepID=A0A8H6VUD8_MYCCL|nr:hypothetical protein HMN09_01158900 [Mycena chlorophos]
MFFTRFYNVPPVDRSVLQTKAMELAPYTGLPKGFIRLYADPATAQLSRITVVGNIQGVVNRRDTGEKYLVLTPPANGYMEQDFNKARRELNKTQEKYKSTDGWTVDPSSRITGSIFIHIVPTTLVHRHAWEDPAWMNINGTGTPGWIEPTAAHARTNPLAVGSTVFCTAYMLCVEKKVNIEEEFAIYDRHHILLGDVVCRLERKDQQFTPYDGEVRDFLWTGDWPGQGKDIHEKLDLVVDEVDEVDDEGTEEEV